MKTLHPHTKISAAELKELERSGKYEKALAKLKTVWTDATMPPDVRNLDSAAAAEIFLRCGSLIGFLGHNEQIPNAQEQSKNLLTEARSRFLDINDLEKIAECENYLALAYWRTGELSEAETWINEALSHDLTNSRDARIYSHLIKSLVFLSSGRHSEIVEYLEPLKIDFQKHGDAFLNGSFCTNLALAYKNLGRTAKALEKLELARRYHQRSGHSIYLGTVENNLAQLHKTQNDYEKAHRAIDRATKIFRKIKDKTREGFSLDTKAHIFFAERNFDAALQTVDKALNLLQNSENAAYLTETLMTRVKILVHSDDFPQAVLCLSDAVQIAKTRIGERAALDLIKEFEKVLFEKNDLKKPVSLAAAGKTENYELVLPPSLAHHRDIQAVRINNAHLENVGLKKGSLAIVVKTEVKRGDLAALIEIETGAAVCGFFDADFGMICLEGCGAEPQLFDSGKVNVLGKIVGSCDSEKSVDGKLTVKPLEL